MGSPSAPDDEVEGGERLVDRRRERGPDERARVEVDPDASGRS